MHLVVGLGNPGARYALNRHNIGFMAAEVISAAFSFGAWSKKFHGQVCVGKIPFTVSSLGTHSACAGPLVRHKPSEEPEDPRFRNPKVSKLEIRENVKVDPRGRSLSDRLKDDTLKKVLILLPETYMNESGRAVQTACTFHKITPENVIVLHDEIEIAPGKIRVKQGGGHGGHNGLKSIDAAIGPDYWRVRLGIGRPPELDNGERMDTADYVLSNFIAAEKKWLTPFLTSIAEHFPLLLSGQPSELMNRVTLDTKSFPPP